MTPRSAQARLAMATNKAPLDFRIFTLLHGSLHEAQGFQDDIPIGREERQPCGNRVRKRLIVDPVPVYLGRAFRWRGIRLR